MYRVLTANTIEALEMSVGVLMDEGWIPAGGVSYINNGIKGPEFIQGVYRTKAPQPKPAAKKAPAKKGVKK